MTRDHEEELAARLREALLFKRLSQAQLDRVVQKAHRIHLVAGESLFEQGDTADRFYLVTSGQIKLYRLSPSGNEKVIEIVPAGRSFAEALMFLDQPDYPVGAEALQTSAVISVDARDFANMLRSSVDTCFLMLGDLSQRLRGLISEIDELSLQSATSRVAGFLLARAADCGDAVELQFPKQVLASRLSVKPETFSRILKKLHEDGVIDVEGNTLRIRAREALRRMAAA